MSQHYYKKYMLFKRLFYIHIGRFLKIFGVTSISRASLKKNIQTCVDILAYVNVREYYLILLESMHGRNLVTLAQSQKMT